MTIQQNLGHADTRTTLNYIGELEADKRTRGLLIWLGFPEWRTWKKVGASERHMAGSMGLDGGKRGGWETEGD